MALQIAASLKPAMNKSRAGLCPLLVDEMKDRMIRELSKRRFAVNAKKCDTCQMTKRECRMQGRNDKPGPKADTSLWHSFVIWSFELVWSFVIRHSSFGISRLLSVRNFFAIRRAALPKTSSTRSA
jgi:hypothetical protein